MADLIDRIKALLEAGQCIVNPHSGRAAEIQITYANGKGSEIWVQRWQDFRGTMITCTGSRFSLSDEDAEKLKPIIDKLMYEERDKQAWYMLKKLDTIERSNPTNAK